MSSHAEVSEFDTLDEYKKDVEKKLAEKKEIEANSQERRRCSC